MRTYLKMSYINKTDAINELLSKGHFEAAKTLWDFPTTDVKKGKIGKISDVEFLYEKFKDVPNFVCGDCECDGAPGIVMTIPIGEKEINLYFDFYGNLSK